MQKLGIQEFLVSTHFVQGSQPAAAKQARSSQAAQEQARSKPAAAQEQARSSPGAAQEQPRSKPAKQPWSSPGAAQEQLSSRILVQNVETRNPGIPSFYILYKDPSQQQPSKPGAAKQPRSKPGPSQQQPRSKLLKPGAAQEQLVSGLYKDPSLAAAKQPGAAAGCSQVQNAQSKLGAAQEQPRSSQTRKPGAAQEQPRSSLAAESLYKM